MPRRAKRKAPDPTRTYALPERIPLPEPSFTMLHGDPVFDAIWRTIKKWDIGVPAAYDGYCDATGNHAAAICLAVRKALDGA